MAKEDLAAQRLDVAQLGKSIKNDQKMKYRLLSSSKSGAQGIWNNTIQMLQQHPLKLQFPDPLVRAWCL